MSTVQIPRRVVIRHNPGATDSTQWEVYLREDGTDANEIARERFENAKVAKLYARELMRLFGVEQLDEEA
jgi:hypothetical protein